MSFYGLHLLGDPVSGLFQPAYASEIHQSIFRIYFQQNVYLIDSRSFALIQRVSMISQNKLLLTILLFQMLPFILAKQLSVTVLPI